MIANKADLFWAEVTGRTQILTDAFTTAVEPVGLDGLQCVFFFLGRGVGTDRVETDKEISAELRILYWGAKNTRRNNLDTAPKTNMESELPQFLGSIFNHLISNPGRRKIR